MPKTNILPWYKFYKGFLAPPSKMFGGKAKSFLFTEQITIVI